MWRSRWDAGVLKAEALALLPCGLGMAFSQSHVMAARRHQHSRLIVEVDEYSSNPTQAFTFYNINQGRFQPPHVQMVDPVPHDAPKPPGYTRFVCVSDTHSRTDPIQMPYGDVLIHAGDFTELGLPSEVKKFNEWLGRSHLPGRAEQFTSSCWQEHQARILLLSLSDSHACKSCRCQGARWNGAFRIRVQVELRGVP
ncbi:PREDICTED: metallophosphoesterase domain-containing protein 1, partial [Galeopterus variegatus]|uniref:Metallophosphoesterase domain-containing protein 1 n=1 Tax=Galeopterus variegatus TaxID=482537 RepID=A0ABM0R816_GALVR